MTRGIANVDYIRQGSEVTVSDAPNWGFLFQSSPIRDPKWNIGDRVVLPDGRVFRYCKASDTIAATSLAVSFSAAVKVAYEAFAAASAAGDTKVHINQAGIVADELRGGYLVYNHDSFTPVFAGIIGNSASDGSNNVEVYLDRALPAAVTTAMSFEILSNPYAAVDQTSTDGKRSFAGVPATTAARGSYLWVQTWGPIWMAPQAGVAAAAYVREVYFRHDGSLDIRANIGTFVSDQRAGFVMDQSDAGQGPPLVMLQVSI
jgi:hypothetical protein